MALFKLDWAFPTQESSFAGGEKFLEYLEAGGPADETAVSYTHLTLPTILRV